MYNGCLKKTGLAFINSLSHATRRIIPFHRRINFSFPERIPINQKTLKASSIRKTNCKGHVQSSKALRRHIGLAVSAANSGRQKETSTSLNIQIELKAIVHGAVDQYTVNQQIKTCCVRQSVNINNYVCVLTGNLRRSTRARHISLKSAKQTRSASHTPTNLRRRKSAGDENFMGIKPEPGHQTCTIGDPQEMSRTPFVLFN